MGAASILTVTVERGGVGSNHPALMHSNRWADEYGPSSRIIGSPCAFVVPVEQEPPPQYVIVAVDETAVKRHRKV